MKKKISTFLGLMISIFALACISGCQTMEGAGRDVQRAGEAIEDAAR